MKRRFQQQLSFFREIDGLKQVFRQTYLLDQSRKENDAEHSWHFAMLSVILSEYATEPLDLLQVLKMALVHDLVEIDAGDTFLYDAIRNADKAQRERKAADRIFGLLPEDQGAELRKLWEEFEAGETPEARFARAMDRLQPLLHNLNTQGRAWREHGIDADQVRDRNRVIEDGAPELWGCALEWIEQAEVSGHLSSGDEEGGEGAR